MVLTVTCSLDRVSKTDKIRQFLIEMNILPILDHFMKSKFSYRCLYLDNICSMKQYFVEKHHISGNDSKNRIILGYKPTSGGSSELQRAARAITSHVFSYAVEKL